MDMLNHLLLVSCICIIIASILYFFYWNRFIAYLIGLFIRLVYWNQGASSIWVEIGMSGGWFGTPCKSDCSMK